jgi:transcriptional regulator GlxA family with amidase domain
MSPRTIGFIVFDEVASAELSGAVEAFARAHMPTSYGYECHCFYALAMTGLLDGREVATHWRFGKDVAMRYPALRVYSNRLFVRDGPFYTCAGGTAAVDFSLSLIEADFGRGLALKLARELIIHLKRLGGEEQYSEPLQFQVQSSDRFADLVAWILCHLGEKLSVEALAQRACMSPRNFARLFKKTFGKTPAEFVAGARMTEARRPCARCGSHLDMFLTTVPLRHISAIA